jgi:gamma-butyrobetaine dioxygenase
LSRRAWSGTTRRAFLVRDYSIATSRWQQAAQQTTVADGVAPHIAGAPAGKSAFKNRLSESVKPSFSKRVTVDLDSKPIGFASIFLRDSCRCSRCVDPSTSQKTFQTADIPVTIEGSCQVCTELENDDTALISWKDDIKNWPEGHQTALPLEFLRNSMQQERDFATKEYNVAKRMFWICKTVSQDIAFLDYGFYMRNDKTLYPVLKMLHTYGLVFVKNVPDTTATDSSTSVASIMNLLVIFY